MLRGVSLTVGPGARIGLAGELQPDRGTVARAGRVGYVPQERDLRADETLLGYLARRTGVAEAEAALHAASKPYDEAAYAPALERFLALGGGDLEARAAQALGELGLPVELDRPLVTLSGGEAARAALASILLARFDVFLLDEPTNDLDFDGLGRLERFVRELDGGAVVVSHDREFLDRTVTRLRELDP